MMCPPPRQVSVQTENTRSSTFSLELPVVKGLVLITLSMRYISTGKECHV
jgi:hypothetical protein